MSRTLKALNNCVLAYMHHTASYRIVSLAQTSSLCAACSSALPPASPISYLFSLVSPQLGLFQNAVLVGIPHRAAFSAWPASLSLKVCIWGSSCVFVAWQFISFYCWNRHILIAWTCMLKKGGREWFLWVCSEVFGVDRCQVWGSSGHWRAEPGVGQGRLARRCGAESVKGGVLLAAGGTLKKHCEETSSQRWPGVSRRVSVFNERLGELPREAYVVGLTIIVTLFNNKAPSD